MSDMSDKSDNKQDIKKHPPPGLVGDVYLMLIGLLFRGGCLLLRG